MIVLRTPTGTSHVPYSMGLPRVAFVECRFISNDNEIITDDRTSQQDGKRSTQSKMPMILVAVLTINKVSITIV